MTRISLTRCSKVYRAVTLLAVVFSLLAAPAAQAQGRRARLSEDLKQRLRQGDQDTTSVIVTGSPARVAAIAAKHGLRIRNALDGAVESHPAHDL